MQKAEQLKMSGDDCSGHVAFKAEQTGADSGSDYGQGGCEGKQENTEGGNNCLGL